VEIRAEDLSNVLGSSQIRDMLFSAVEGNTLWKTRIPIRHGIYIPGADESEAVPD
jgi:hypothetical protein